MSIELFHPGDFDPPRHFYPRVLNAQLHPLVRNFLNLGNERIVQRYTHLHPEADPASVQTLLTTKPRYFRWGGADLFLSTNEEGLRQIVVIETNSSPSGQKSMPILDEADELGGYRRLIERSFMPMVEARRRLPSGALAVLYDKNEMEASGYAATIAELSGEEVMMVPCHRGKPLHRIDDGVVEIDTPEGWKPVRACLRYVTQQPWERLPPVARTAIYNPIVACLAGGRNKAVAAKSYDLFNALNNDTGLTIRMPETIWDVAKTEVPMWVQSMGGVAVVKNPYSNAGQGVYTITNENELAAFMDSDQSYDRFIVQALIGNFRWSSRTRAGRLYHVGTIPDKRGRLFAADIRFMVGAGPEGFFPVAIYARRAREALEAELPEGTSSWDMLGTNLSVKQADGSWTTQTDRLFLVDSRDFNKLGIGVDDLIEGYLQTVMAVTSIDAMAKRLITQKSVFRRRFYKQLNPDPRFVDEIMT